MQLRLTYIGGPTALLDIDGVRLLTDPTFDPAGSEYKTPVYVLHKTAGPALTREAVGRIDAVLLSHDHHFDNLDRAGREMLQSAGCVMTTRDGAARLGGKATGLMAGETHELTAPDGRVLTITATPARHGPADGDRGPVIGFVCAFTDDPARTIYISGDTVWYDGVAEIGRRADPGVAVLFGGAARVREVGPAHLTMTADELVTFARTFEHAQIVPLHFEGWAHFSETRGDIARAFDAAGLAGRIHFPIAGQPLDLVV